MYQKTDISLSGVFTTLSSCCISPTVSEEKTAPYAYKMRSSQPWYSGGSERQTKRRQKNRVFNKGRQDTAGHVEPTQMSYPLHSTRVRIRAPRYAGATALMEYLQPNHTKGTLRQLHTLERRTSSPKTKGRWSGPQIKPRPIPGNRFMSHHLSSDF